MNNYDNSSLENSGLSNGFIKAIDEKIAQLDGEAFAISKNSSLDPTASLELIKAVASKRLFYDKIRSSLAGKNSEQAQKLVNDFLSQTNDLELSGFLKSLIIDDNSETVESAFDNSLSSRESVAIITSKPENIWSGDVNMGDDNRNILVISPKKEEQWRENNQANDEINLHLKELAEKIEQHVAYLSNQVKNIEAQAKIGDNPFESLVNLVNCNKGLVLINMELQEAWRVLSILTPHPSPKDGETITSIIGNKVVDYELFAVWEKEYDRLGALFINLTNFVRSLDVSYFSILANFIRNQYESIQNLFSVSKNKDEIKNKIISLLSQTDQASQFYWGTISDINFWAAENNSPEKLTSHEDNKNSINEIAKNLRDKLDELGEEESSDQEKSTDERDLQTLINLFETDFSRIEQYGVYQITEDSNDFDKDFDILWHKFEDLKKNHLEADKLAEYELRFYTLKFAVGKATAFKSLEAVELNDDPASEMDALRRKVLNILMLTLDKITGYVPQSKRKQFKEDFARFSRNFSNYADFAMGTRAIKKNTLGLTGDTGDESVMNLPGSDTVFPLPSRAIAAAIRGSSGMEGGFEQPEDWSLVSHRVVDGKRVSFEYLGSDVVGYRSEQIINPESGKKEIKENVPETAFSYSMKMLDMFYQLHLPSLWPESRKTEYSNMRMGFNRKKRGEFKKVVEELGMWVRYKEWKTNNRVEYYGSNFESMEKSLENRWTESGFVALEKIISDKFKIDISTDDVFRAFNLSVALLRPFVLAPGSFIGPAIPYYALKPDYAYSEAAGGFGKLSIRLYRYLFGLFNPSISPYKLGLTEDSFRNNDAKKNFNIMMRAFALSRANREDLIEAKMINEDASPDEEQQKRVELFKHARVGLTKLGREDFVNLSDYFSFSAAAVGLESLAFDEYEEALAEALKPTESDSIQRKLAMGARSITALKDIRGSITRALENKGLDVRRMWPVINGPLFLLRPTMEKLSKGGKKQYGYQTFMCPAMNFVLRNSKNECVRHSTPDGSTGTVATLASYRDFNSRNDELNVNGDVSWELFPFENSVVEDQVGEALSNLVNVKKFFEQVLFDTAESLANKKGAELMADILKRSKYIVNTLLPYALEIKAGNPEVTTPKIIRLLAMGIAFMKGVAMAERGAGKDAAKGEIGGYNLSEADEHDKLAVISALEAVYGIFEFASTLVDETFTQILKKMEYSK
ncbi:MAG: hypothetical protein ACOZAN_01370 [Patescibacteria group bacterium]